MTPSFAGNVSPILAGQKAPASPSAADPRPVILAPAAFQIDDGSDAGIGRLAFFGRLAAGSALVKAQGRRRGLDPFAWREVQLEE